LLLFKRLVEKWVDAKGKQNIESTWDFDAEVITTVKPLAYG